MKIGVTSVQFQDSFGDGAAFDGLRAIGYDGVHFSLNVGYKKSHPIFSKPAAVWQKFYRETAKRLADSGLEVFHTHATFPTDENGSRVVTDERLAHFEKEIEASAILGAPYIVIHPISFAVLEREKEEDFAANVEFFTRLEPILRRYDIKLGVENMFTFDGLRSRLCPTGCSLPEDMIRYIDAMESDRFVACLDTGHMMINSVTPALAARKLGKRLKLLHVHDNLGSRDDHFVPTMGATDWKAFGQALADIGYDGAFTMELNFAIVAAISPDLCWDYARYAYAAAKKIVEGAGL